MVTEYSILKDSIRSLLQEIASPTIVFYRKKKGMESNAIGITNATKRVDQRIGS
jgi:hypothetical protein